MVISIGADHGGVAYKNKIVQEFSKQGIEFKDVGSYEIDPSDNYAEISIRVGELVQKKEADFGIMICRTGVGAVVMLNKMKGIRAGVLESVEAVCLARAKNNVNVLSFGADNICVGKAIKIVKKFIGTEFEGGRHNARLGVIADYEERHSK